MENPDPVITFFIPCLNEEGNVGRTIDMVVGVMKERKEAYEVVVIDDASVDGTVEEVRRHEAKHPGLRLQLVINRFTRGLGRNYFIAAQRARGEYFMIVNGDASETPELMLTMLSHRGKADAIIPYFDAGENRSLKRRLISRSFVFCVSLLSGHRLKYYNGPVLHKTENVRAWFCETAGFGYQAELLCRLLDENITYMEVEVPNNDRVTGVTKAFRFSNILAVSNSLFHIWLRRLQHKIIRREAERTSRIMREKRP